jgi:hypothetical protein
VEKAKNKRANFIIIIRQLYSEAVLLICILFVYALKIKVLSLIVLLFGTVLTRN